MENKKKGKLKWEGSLKNRECGSITKHERMWAWATWKGERWIFRDRNCIKYNTEELSERAQGSSLPMPFYIMPTFRIKRTLV